MFFTETKLNRRKCELEEKRYFGRRDIGAFVAMEGQLSKDESNLCIPEKIEGGTFEQNDRFVGRDRYLWIEKEMTFPEPKEGCEVVGLFDFGKSPGGNNHGFESCVSCSFCSKISARTTTDYY